MAASRTTLTIPWSSIAAVGAADDSAKLDFTPLGGALISAVGIGTGYRSIVVTEAAPGSIDLLPGGYKCSIQSLRTVVSLTLEIPETGPVELSSDSGVIKSVSSSSQASIGGVIMQGPKGDPGPGPTYAAATSTGAITLDGAVGVHEVTLTGNATITIDSTGTVLGQDCLIWLTRAGHTATVEGVSVTTADPAMVYAVKLAAGWQVVVAGAAPSTPDTTPPSAVGAVTVGTITESSIVFSWPAATDAESSVSYQWRVIPSGGSASAWTDTTATTATATGLAPSTSHTLEVYAYSAGGSSAAAFTTATTGIGWGLWAADGFDGTSGTVLTGRALPEGNGGQSWTSGGSQWQLDGAGKAVYLAGSWGDLTSINLPATTKDGVRITALGCHSDNGITIRFGYLEGATARDQQGAYTVRAISVIVNPNGTISATDYGANPGTFTQTVTPTMGSTWDLVVEAGIGTYTVKVGGVTVGTGTYAGAPAGVGGATATQASFDGGLGNTFMNRFEVEVQ